MSEPADRDLLIALNAADTVTRAALCRLGASLDAWRRAPPEAEPTLAASLGVPCRQLRRALELRSRAAALADAEATRAEIAGARLVTTLDPDYPPALRHLALPPPVLAVRGALPDPAPAVAVVGSRRADGYGREAAAYFADGLARAGATVVSGFARGVDAVAHRAALDAGGTTVAVLGCGVDVAYPAGHGELGERIAGAGAVVSELACGAPPRTWHFPVRNRLIAALGDVTLVIQAALRSGSLSTAHHALELGRDVWAVPGRIFDPLSLGANALVADGAFVARGLPDLLEALGLGEVSPASRRPEVASASTFAAATPSPAPGPAPPSAGLAGGVLGALPPGERRTADDLAEALGVPVDRVLGALLELELGGWLRREPGPVYLR